MGVLLLLAPALSGARTWFNGRGSALADYFGANNPMAQRHLQLTFSAMNTIRFLFSISVALALSLFTAQAQSLLQVSFHGTYYTTNSSGAITAHPVTEKTWLQEFASQHGISDLSTIAVAYHIGANSLGNTLDIVNTSNGSVLWTLMGFYFGESFGRQALYSADGHQVKRLDYIYTSQNDHSLGSAFITQRYFTDRTGKTSRIAMSGQMQWVVESDASGPTKMYTGTFVTGRVLQ
jgi:hypothetical protein